MSGSTCPHGMYYKVTLTLLFLSDTVNPVHCITALYCPEEMTYPWSRNASAISLLPSQQSDIFDKLCLQQYQDCSFGVCSHHMFLCLCICNTTYRCPKLSINFGLLLVAVFLLFSNKLLIYFIILLLVWPFGFHLLLSPWFNFVFGVLGLYLGFGQQPATTV